MGDSGRHGFVVAVTNVETVGQGLIRDGTGFVTFPVKYQCVVFRPFKGEILESVVTMVNKVGSVGCIGLWKSRGRIRQGGRKSARVLCRWDFLRKPDLYKSSCPITFVILPEQHLVVHSEDPWSIYAGDSAY